MERLLQFLAPHARLYISVAVLILGLATLDRAVRQHTPKTDYTVYHRAAQALLTGENIYEVQNERGWNYVYPSLFAITLIPIAKLPVWAAVSVFYLLSAAAVLHAIVLSRKIVPGIPASFLAWSTLFVAPAFISGLTRGQASLFVGWLVVLAIHAWQAERLVRAGLALAGAVLLKIFPLPLLLIFLCRRQWRAVLVCLGGILAGLFVIPIPVLGWRLTVDYVWQWLARVGGPALNLGAHRAASPLFSQLLDPGIPRNQSITALLTRWTGAPHVMGLALGIAGVLGILLLVAALRAERSRHVHVACATICWCLLASPVAETHYFFLLLVPLAALARAGRNTLFYLAGALAAAAVIIPQARWLGTLGIATGILFFAHLRGLRRTTGPRETKGQECSEKALFFHPAGRHSRD